MAAYRGWASVLRYLLADAFLDTSLRNDVSDAAYLCNWNRLLCRCHCYQRGLTALDIALSIGKKKIIALLQMEVAQRWRC